MKYTFLLFVVFSLLAATETKAQTNTAPVSPASEPNPFGTVTPPKSTGTDDQIDPEMTLVPTSRPPSTPQTNAVPVVAILPSTNAAPAPVILKGYLVVLWEESRFIDMYRGLMKSISDKKSTGYDELNGGSVTTTYYEVDVNQVKKDLKSLNNPNYLWNQIQDTYNEGRGSSFKNLPWAGDALTIPAPKKESILMVYPYMEGSLSKAKERVVYFEEVSPLGDVIIREKDMKDFEAIHNAEEMRHYVDRL